MRKSGLRLPEGQQNDNLLLHQNSGFAPKVQVGYPDSGVFVGCGKYWMRPGASFRVPAGAHRGSYTTLPAQNVV